MDKLVVLKLDGDLEQNGFRVTLEVGKDNARPDIETYGSLPPSPDLSIHLNEWQEKYRSFTNNNNGRIKPKQISYGGSINSSINECNDAATKLKKRLQNWLNSQDFRRINNILREALNRDENIRVLIRTDNQQLQQLPWHLWDFFNNYSNAEFALSGTEYEKTEKPQPQEKVRVLAILGNSDGINLEKDKELLENLPEAETVFLKEPQRNELNNYLWKQWDILFFAGHSETDGDTGKIYINQTDWLTIKELSNGLRQAIDQGLQLAIFNSCDGLGLARQLNSLNIPQIIVMREPVPDRVAQEFFKHFLVAFSNGKPLYLALREAREKLQGLEDKCPNATWLPVIFQNPGATPLTWKEFLLRNTDENTPNVSKIAKVRTRSKFSLFHLLITSIIVTASVLGVRYLGILQHWELQAYDRLMRTRPEDKNPENRIFIVGITEEDLKIREQKDKIGSLSDFALDRLLEKLESYKPRAIGLDIFRDFPVDSKEPALKNRLRNNNRFFASCQVGEPGNLADEQGIESPPDVPAERQGFSNFIVDSDRVIRRHLLSMDVPSASRCQSPVSLSFQLASHYLLDEGILKDEDLPLKPTSFGNWKLGDVEFKHLKSPSAGYQKADMKGNQVLLNYHSYNSLSEFVEIVSLKDILRNKVNPKAVENRIVLIGVVARTSSDYFLTPYSAANSTFQEIPGVVIHAQMISQILSAVLDGRPLIEVWPFWGDWILIWGSSVVGGALAWRFRLHQWLVLLVGGVAVAILYGGSLWLLIQGTWVALVPSALALIVTGGIVLLCNSLQSQDRSNLTQI